MKLLAILFLLKLYACINISIHIEEKYEQKEIKLARVTQKQRSRITKIECDIKYSLFCKRNNLTPLFAKPKFSIRISHYLPIKLDVKYWKLKSRINIEKNEHSNGNLKRIEPKNQMEQNTLWQNRKIEIRLPKIWQTKTPHSRKYHSQFFIVQIHTWRRTCIILQPRWSYTNKTKWYKN